MALEKEEENALEKFFQARKTYVRIGLIIFGAFIVFLMYRKMKEEYVS